MKEQLPPDFALLVLGPPGVGKLEYLLDAAKFFLEREDKVVFVTVDQPPTRVRAAAQRIGLDLPSLEGDRFLFVDCYSASTGQEPAEAEKVFHVTSLSNIEQIGMNVVKACDKLRKPLRIFLYTASPLFLYNSNQAIARFFQIITAQIRSKYGSLTYALHGGTHDKMTVETLKMFAEGVVEMAFDDQMRRWMRVQYFKGLRVDTRWREFTLENGALNVSTEEKFLNEGLRRAESPFMEVQR